MRRNDRITVLIVDLSIPAMTLKDTWCASLWVSQVLDWQALSLTSSEHYLHNEDAARWTTQPSSRHGGLFLHSVLTDEWCLPWTS